MSLGQRRTKIVCTLGPSSNSEEQIEQLVLSGMNMARINFSHGSHDEHATIIKTVRKVAEQYEVTLPILADLQGPKIRVGEMKDDGQKLEKGTYVTL